LWHADLNGENLKLRDRVGSLLNEARYKEALNSNLRQDMKQLLGEGGNTNPPPPGPYKRDECVRNLTGCLASRPDVHPC